MDFFADFLQEVTSRKDQKVRHCPKTWLAQRLLLPPTHVARLRATALCYIHCVDVCDSCSSLLPVLVLDFSNNIQNRS